MVNRCKSCGKFVKKDAKVCKHCGQKNPVEKNSTRLENDVFASDKTEDNNNYAVCPYCNHYNTVSHRAEKIEILNCTVCGRSITNPYFKKPLFNKEQKTGLGCALFVFVFFIIVFIASNSKNNVSNTVSTGKNKIESSIPVKTSDWHESEMKQEFDFDSEEGFSNEIIVLLEKQHGIKIEEILDKYIGKPIGNQEILLQEPLKSLLIKCIGIDGLRFMTLCRISQEGLIKEYGNCVTYRYDCYLDSPNGNYFSLAFITNGISKSLFLEIKIKDKVYNVSVDELH